MAFDCFSTLNASIIELHTLSRTAACPDGELWTIWKEARVLKTWNPLNMILYTPYFPSPTAFWQRFVQEKHSWLPFLVRARHLSDLHVLSDGRLVFVCLLALCAVKARCVSSRDRRKTCNCFRYDGCATVAWVLWRGSFLKQALRSHFTHWQKKKADGLLCTDIFPSLLHILQSLSSARYFNWTRSQQTSLSSPCWSSFSTRMMPVKASWTPLHSQFYSFPSYYSLLELKVA